MAIDKETHLYEILVRFGPEGYRGSHVQDLIRVIDTETGQVYSEQPTDARPVTKAEIGSLIGAKNAGLIEELEREKTARLEAEAERDALVAERDDATQRLEKARAALMQNPAVS